MDPCNDALGNLGIQVPGDLLQDNLSKSQICKCNWNWELTSGKLGFGFKNLENSGAQFCDVEWQDFLALIHLQKIGFDSGTPRKWWYFVRLLHH